MDRMSPVSELMWDKLKYAAIRRLRGSSADGPKRLRTVVPFPGPLNWVELKPKLEVKEIVV